MFKQTSLKHYSFFLIPGSLILVSLFLFFVFIMHKSEDKVSKPVLPALSQATPKPSSVFVGETEVFVEVADTREKRTLGLSGKEALGEKNGMLFIFGKSGLYSFWMKEMRFSIDIIWIDESFHVADITEEISPESFPDMFRPAVPIRYVLEVPAGFIKKQNVTKGEKITFSFAGD
ncbi:MAG: DUF192 domain-containing protein [Candidatus Yonathbacteria bacterium]|nr:DUF192 domain-containing protein [Candidatus Yonathbacteria bacterium]